MTPVAKMVLVRANKDRSRWRTDSTTAITISGKNTRVHSSSGGATSRLITPKTKVIAP